MRRMQRRGCGHESDGTSKGETGQTRDGGADLTIRKMPLQMEEGQRASEKYSERGYLLFGLGSRRDAEG